MSTAVPTLLGKYRILGLLGQGGMGAVYRAEDTVLLRHVAVKVMSEAIARESTLRDRFLREARAAGSLQHPNIVTVHDFGEVEGHLFIAMELVDGADLESLLARPEPLPLDTKLAIVGDLLAGLGYAHRHGVVHRDIKPPNIQVTSDGRVKLMDFGIAYVGASNLTGTGLALGTPSYMAPEQVTGGPVTAAADLFATGVVLYELIAGVRPFVGPSMHSILFKIVSEEPPDLSTLAPSVPPALIQVVARALQKDPAARYQSAPEMAEELAAARMTTSEVPSARSGAWTRAVSAAAATPSGVPLTIAPGVGSAPVATTTAHSVSRPRGRWIAGGAAACALVAGALWASHRVPGTPPAARAAAASPAGTDSAGTARAEVPAPLPAAVASTSAPLASTAPRATAAESTPVAVTRRAGSAAVPSAPALRGIPATVPTAARPTAIAAPGGTSPAADRPPVAAPAAAAAEAAAPPSAAAVSAEIAATARAYAHAIESRDLAAVRRVYPGLTDTQESGFRQFFDAARNLHVTFAVSGVEVAGTTADARLTGTYDFTTTDGQHQRQPVEFAATLRREDGVWRLASVR